MANNEKLLAVTGLKKYFPVTGKTIFSRIIAEVKAVDDVTFSIGKGKTLALVGESGCGKTTIGRTILQLERPTAGTVTFKGQDLCKMDSKKLHSKRREMQLIFQDPYDSLDPRIRIGSIIAEPLKIHKLVNKKQLAGKIEQLLLSVGLKTSHINRYPHELSGGQRQRVSIARTIATEPDFIIADEPVSALDVSVQMQIMELLSGLQKRLNLTYLLITHNLAIVPYISNEVAVMYLGKIVEIAECQELFSNPLHPYTHALLSAIPIPDPEIEMKRVRVKSLGDIPNPVYPPNGCTYHTRCPKAKTDCREIVPELKLISDGHSVSCHLFGERKNI